MNLLVAALLLCPLVSIGADLVPVVRSAVQSALALRLSAANGE